MARIVYVAVEDLSRESGVSRKIDSQVRTWRSTGHDVVIISADGRELRSVRWLQAVNALLAEAASFGADYSYVRFSTWVPALERLYRRTPTVLEMNSDDLVESRSRRSAFGRYHRMTRGRALRGAAGIVVPSKELAERPHIGGIGRSVAVIPNGIDLAATELLPVPANERPRLGFTYTTQGDWVGVGDIIDLARTLPEFDFWIVGPRPDRPVPQNVTTTGYLTGDSLRAVMAKFDVGIGSLALFRAGLNEGSTLKVRGYLASGIPVIVGHRDSDFPAGAPFLLTVPNQAGAIVNSSELVREFVHRSAGTRVSRDQIQHIDIRDKERTRLDFLLTR